MFHGALILGGHNFLHTWIPVAIFTPSWPCAHKLYRHVWSWTESRYAGTRDLASSVQEWCPVGMDAIRGRVT